MVVYSLARIVGLLMFGRLAAGSIFLDAHPANISLGLTDDLDVNCSFSQQNVTNVSSVVTLLISYAPALNNPANNFQDLYSINAFIPGSVAQLSSINATVSGHIEPSGSSYLSLHWERPSSQQGGLYRCDAYGFDSVGRPVKMSREAQVDSHVPDSAELLEKINELEEEVDNLKQNQSDLMKMLDEKSAELAECESKLDNLTQCQNELQRLRKRLCPYPDDFDISTQRNGTHYLLSKADWRNASVAEETCELYGGYLAEIDNSSEHLFIKNFLYGSNTAPQYVLVGATDEFQEGYWQFRYSRRQVVYNAWSFLEPDNQPDYDCAELHRDITWNMADYPCITSWTGRKFLCEIPPNYS